MTSEQNLHVYTNRVEAKLRLLYPNAPGNATLSIAFSVDNNVTGDNYARTVHSIFFHNGADLERLENDLARMVCELHAIRAKIAEEKAATFDGLPA